MPAVKKHTEELRAALIDQAGRLLRDEGPAAVTLRRVAGASHTSTAAVYTLFGDKGGLVEQMYVEGFERLARTVAAVRTTDDPVQDLLAIGRAYRRAALRNRHLYELMFGRPVPGFTPSRAATAIAAEAFAPVAAAVRRCVEAGAFRADADPDAAAYHLWALAHGLVALELHRTVPLRRAEHARRFDAASAAGLASYLA